MGCTVAAQSSKLTLKGQVLRRRRDGAFGASVNAASLGCGLAMSGLEDALVGSASVTADSTAGGSITSDGLQLGNSISSTLGGSAATTLASHGRSGTTSLASMALLASSGNDG